VANTPFIQSFSLTDPGTTPTFSWTVPAGSSHTRQSILIFDLEGQLASTGSPPVIFDQFVIGNTVRSFTVASGVLRADHRYSVSIQLDDTSPGRLVSRSRSFFDFTTGATAGASGPVILPPVDPAGGPSGEPVYHFNAGEVIAGNPVFVDPFVAIGYVFEKGAGDQNFASVLLPDVGDGVFSVTFDDGGGTTTATVNAGVAFSFPTGGVGGFTVEDIETSAGLDPLDSNAFATGLTCVANSTFTCTITPIRAFVADVPEPATAAPRAAGIGFFGRRRRQR